MSDKPFPYNHIYGLDKKAQDRLRRVALETIRPGPGNGVYFRDIPVSALDIVWLLDNLREEEPYTAAYPCGTTAIGPNVPQKDCPIHGAES